MVHSASRNGCANTVHHPVLSTWSSGRNDVISTPTVGTNQTTQITVTTIRTPQPPFLGSPTFPASPGTSRTATWPRCGSVATAGGTVGELIVSAPLRGTA